MSIRQRIAATGVVAILIAGACGPSPPPPRPVTGSTYITGRYALRHFRDEIIVCQVYVNLETSLIGDSRADSLVWAVHEAALPGCTYADWSLSMQLECVPQCGKAYLAIGHLEQLPTSLKFLRWPHRSYLRITLTGSYQGFPPFTMTDASSQIVCDPLPRHRCLFHVDSPN